MKRKILEAMQGPDGQEASLRLKIIKAQEITSRLLGGRMDPIMSWLCEINYVEMFDVFLGYLAGGMRLDGRIGVGQRAAVFEEALHDAVDMLTVLNNIDWRNTK